MVEVSKFKILIANIFPFAARVSRFSKALWAAYSKEKMSYSQHAEDVFIWELLTTNFPNTQYNYIDVGAFHPTLLSNTYLLYRKNVNGITIEPNRELINLHKNFRPNDIQLEVACGDFNQLSRFFFQTTFPALSSLNHVITKKSITSQFVPVFNLNTICKSFDFPKIYFLSIDVEGFDYEVLQGAKEILSNTFIVCIECNTKESEENTTIFLERKDFILIKKFACNLIFKNQKFTTSLPL